MARRDDDRIEASSGWTRALVIGPALEALALMAELAQGAAWLVEYPKGDTAPPTIFPLGSGDPAASRLSQDEISDRATQALSRLGRAATPLAAAYDGVVTVPFDLPQARGAVVVALGASAGPDHAERLGAWLAAELARLGAPEASDLAGAEVVRTDPTGTVVAATRGAGALLVRGEVGGPGLVGAPIDEVLARLVPGLEASVARVAPGEIMRLWLSPAVGADLALTAERLSASGGAIVVTACPAATCSDDARLRDRLIAAIRHEIRAPLTVLRGVVSVLEEEPDMDVRDRLEFVRSLRRETTRVISFVEDLLTLARLTAGRGLYRAEAVDLAESARDAVQRLLRVPEAKGLDVEVIVEGASAVVEGEPELVRQMLRSILGHALRAAPRGARATLRVSGGADGIRVTLRDDGPPTAEEESAATLVAFRRSTSDGKYLPGAAIGMLIAKKIADAHGWGMSARRSDDGWNVVEVRVPRTAPAAVSGAD